MNTPNEFEQLLEKVAPDIYLLHRMSASNPQLWRAVHAMMEMIKDKDKGRLVLHITAGRIEHVEQVKMLSAYTGVERVE